MPPKKNNPAKSMTLWGVLMYAATQYAEAKGIIPGVVAETLKTGFIALGLYGARNNH